MLFEGEEALNLPEAESIRLLGALLALLIASQVMGGIMQKLHQPRVIGEILGGVCLALLGGLFPQAFRELFFASEAHQQSLGFFCWLGLLLLMFCAGMETNRGGGRSGWKSIFWLTSTGLLIPLGAGLLLSRTLDFSSYWGARGNPLLFGLVLGMGLAVTSIPVISKIFFDLGLSDTPFAHVALSVAMIADALLWALLSLTIGLSDGLSASPLNLLSGVIATAGFFALCLLFGHRFFDAFIRSSWNPFKTAADGIPPFLLFFAVVLMGYALGVNPIFGAFLAGRIAARSETVKPETMKQIAFLSFALFIPVFFASVGLKLDLGRGFPFQGFLFFLTLACLVKISATYLGGLLAGQKAFLSLHLAIALNARGSLGIALATVALDAQLINKDFYAILVLVSLLTTQGTGWWLLRTKNRALSEFDLSTG
ncbi:MAG TPA: cation:proton antiporter [Cyanobacteria bacterium UBA8530]|nr:cation:proton antiporter [Cyanobacteria bacterium UBA8530]